MSLSACEWQVGDWVDVRDTSGLWCGVRIAEKTEDSVLVRCRIDEWLPWSSPRLAPFRQHSGSRERAPASWDQIAKECRACVDDLVALEDSLDNFETWTHKRVTNLLCGELPSLVETLLGHEGVGEGVAGARALEANRLFLQFLHFFIAWLRFAVAQPPVKGVGEPSTACFLAFTDLAGIFTRIFGAPDRRATAFFEAHAGLPERHVGISALWPGSDPEWLSRAAKKSLARHGEVSLPTAWLLLRIRGVEDAVTLSSLEAHLRHLPLLYCNALTFCAMGGVEEIVNSLTPLALDGVRGILVSISVLVTAPCGAFQPECSRPWVDATLPRLLEALRGRVVAMSDDEVKNLDRDQVLRCVFEPVIRLLERCRVSRGEIEDLRDELVLLLCHRRLKSQFLERRLKALSDVKEMVDRAARNGTGSGLARWLADDGHAIMLILCARPHPEVLRRANFLLRFLASERLLTLENIRALWACGCAADKHDDLTSCVLDLFVEIAAALNREQATFIMERVTTQNDVRFLRFLRDFLLASHRTGESPEDGLALFWKWIQDPDEGSETPRVSSRASSHNVATSVVDQARACFLDLLRSPHFSGHRSHYLQACWTSLCETPNTSRVRLLRDVVDTFPAGKDPLPVGEAERRDAVLRSLGSESRAPSEVLLDIALHAVADEGGDDPQNDLFAAVLDTLFYVLIESSLQVTYDGVERLWKSSRGLRRDLVARWLSRAAGYTFSSKIFGRPHWDLWPNSDHVRFFNEVLRKEIDMSHDELVCYINYMKLCNLKPFNPGLAADTLLIPETPSCSGMISRGTRYSQLVGPDGVETGDLAAAAGRRFRVIRSGMIGSEELWEVCMQVTDPIVFDESSDFLVALCVFLHPNSSLYQKTQVQTVFFRRCMHILEKSEDWATHGTRVHKALTLLTKLIHFMRLRTERHQTSGIWPTAPKDRREPAASFHLKLRTESGTSQKTLYIQRSATIGSLRCKAAALLQLHPGDTGLCACPSMQAVDPDLDVLTIEECQLSPSLYAAPRVREETPGTSWQMTEKDTEILLNLLSEEAVHLHCEVPAWALLSCLPISDRIAGIFSRIAKWGLEANTRSRPLARLVEPATANINHQAVTEFKEYWQARVLRSGSQKPQMHRLLYALRVIRRLLLGKQGSRGDVRPGEHLTLESDSFTTGDRWALGFTQAGGLELLLGVFVNIYEDTDAHTQPCISLLAESICKLLEKRRAVDIDLNALQAAAPRIVQSLVRVVQRSGQDVDDTPHTAFSANVLRLCSVGTGQEEVAESRIKSSDASVCVARLFALWRLVLKRDPSDSSIVDDLGEFLRCGLFATDPALRAAVAAGVQSLCASDLGDVGARLNETLLAKLLFDVVPDWDQNPSKCQELLSLVSKLLKRYRAPGVLNSSTPLHLDVRLPGLLDLLTNQLGKDDKDANATLWMLEVMHSILHSFPHLKGPASKRLSVELLRCIIGDAAQGASTGADEGVPWCHTSRSRRLVLSLLHELAIDSSESCHWVVEHLLSSGVGLPLPGNRWRANDWLVHPDSVSKSSTGFVGLKNLGATCYMNSVLQQLYAHPEFRRGLLALSPPPGYGQTLGTAQTPRQREETPTQTSTELLYQLQVLFSSLQSSQRQYNSPHAVCAAFRDWEGRPVNVLQQMDADEFLNLLVDQLERGMGDSPVFAHGSSIPDAWLRTEGVDKSPLRRLFGGTLCTEIIPKSDAPRSEKHEDFLVMSLLVKGKSSVLSSLEAFVEGETLEGDNAYFSEEAGYKVDAVKRTCVSRLPETLIFVLKRFEFDFDTMQKVKVNDFCEFPMHLNMYPYTKEGVDSGSDGVGGVEFEYELCGVVLHAGVADSGHYSSLVKVVEDDKRAEWYEFNDSLVKPFAEDDIPCEAFGARQSEDDRGMAYGNHTKNAYLLFYERATTVRGPMRKHTATHGAVMQSVEAANRQHWYTQAVFALEFADFAWMFTTNFLSLPLVLSARDDTKTDMGALKLAQLTKLRSDSSEQTQHLPEAVCRFATSFVFTVIARSQGQSLSEWCATLRRLLLQAGLPAQRWFAGLLSSHGFVRESFLECPMEGTRTALLSVAVQVLRLIYQDEARNLQSFTNGAPGGDPRHGQTATEWGAPKQFADGSLLLPPIWATLLELLPVASQPQVHNNLSQFFELMGEFLNLGPETLAWAFKAGGIDELLLFALQEANSQIPALLEQSQRWYEPNWLRVPTAADVPKRPVPPEMVLGVDAGEALDAEEQKELHEDIDLAALWGVLASLLELDISRVAQHSEENDAVIRRVVRGGSTTSRPACRLLQLYCRDDLARSQGVTCMICERIDGGALRDFRILRLGTALVELSDRCAQQRCVFLVKSVLHVAKNNPKFRVMHSVIHYFVKWCRRRTELPQWLQSDAAHVSVGSQKWLETWLKDAMNAADSQNWNSNGPYGRDDTVASKLAWCQEMLPLVKRIARGEALPKEVGGDSDGESNRTSPLSRSANGSRFQVPVLSKVQIVEMLVTQQQQQRQHQQQHANMPSAPVWYQ